MSDETPSLTALQEGCRLHGCCPSVCPACGQGMPELEGMAFHWCGEKNRRPVRGSQFTSRL